MLKPSVRPTVRQRGSVKTIERRSGNLRRSNLTRERPKVVVKVMATRLERLWAQAIRRAIERV